MIDNHWFDALSKLLVRDAPRRTVLGAAALVASLTLGDAPITQAGKHRRKKKRKKERPKPPPPSCSGGACAAVPEWSGNQEEINHCEFICRQCGGDDPREFCIVPRALGPVAECCDVDETCCDGQCCRSYCCHLGPERGSECVVDRAACCPDDINLGFCDLATQICCPGHGCVYRIDGCPDGGCSSGCMEFGVQCCHGDCVNITVDEEHCGGCDQPCGPGLNCCDGACVDIMTDRRYCGGCGSPACTVPGWLCCDGDCKNTNSDEENCGGCGQTCIGPDLRCCDGDCVNTRTDPNNCGGCGRGGSGFLCCGGHFYDPALQFCCPDEPRPCYNSQICCVSNDGTPACCAPP